jgi:predicted ATPase/DNA-binding SARP family transcriptional activator/class 3 adenylate cyclase
MTLHRSFKNPSRIVTVEIRMAEELQLALLGSPKIQRDGVALAGLTSSKAQALLFYLAVTGGTHLRPMLVGLLWPNQLEASARNNLSKTLTHLRKTVSDHLDITRQSVAFDRESLYWLDVEDFGRAVLAQPVSARTVSAQPDMERLARAVELYRGDFLEGFYVRQVPAFEEWVLVQRARLRELALQALHALVAHHTAQGPSGHAAAIDYATRLLALEPWREEAHRALMRLLALSGQRSAALAQYETCVSTLKQELGVAPSAETKQLYVDIRDGKVKPLQQEAAARPRFVSTTPSLSPPPTVVSESRSTLLAGERRRVTVLHVEIDGTALLLDELGPQVWAQIDADVRQVIEREVHRYGGEPAQPEPRGATALFGVPAAHEDDAERAILTALAMQEAIARYAAEVGRQVDVSADPIALQMRVGVNSGEVIVASAGDRKGHGEDMAMGRAVTLAAEMAQAAEPGTVLVAENTYRLVGPLFEWQPLGEIAVRGASQPLAVYRPLWHVPTRDKVRGIAGRASPLVGRDEELGALQQAVDRLREGVGGIVTVVGEAGIGKSRLVAEIRKCVLNLGEGSASGQIADGKSEDTGRSGQHSTFNVQPATPQWVEGRCMSYTTDVAYCLWLALLRGLLNAGPDASPVAVRRSEAETLKTWLRTLCPDCLDDVYPHLGRLLALPLEAQAADRLRGIDAEGLKMLTFRAVETLLERAAARRPLVVVCEDLHWADPSSLALLESLFSLADRAPLLLVCVLRPETAHGCWRIREAAARDYPHRHLDLWLKPLFRDEETALIANLLSVSNVRDWPIGRAQHVENLPPALRERILSYTEGNPFHVEEILRSLIDRGAIAHDQESGCWRAAKDVLDIPIPDALHGVLASRIDRLPAGARRVLQVASVIGHHFSYRLLEAVVGANSLAPGKEELDDHLVTLQRAQMIHERARLPEREYVFKHVLTAEAAYDGLLRRDRRDCHRKVAEALERLYPERVEEQLGLLAHHWERAEERERAVVYLQRAGEQAASHYANEEAVGYFSRALALVPGTERAQRYSLLLARERVHDRCGNREAQQRDLSALEAIAAALDDDRRLAEVALRQANYAHIVGSDNAGAAAAAQRAIRHARLAEDVVSEAEGYLLWGRATPGTERGEEGFLAVSRLEEGLRLSRAAHDRMLEADCLRELGLWSNVHSDYAAALDYYEQALQLCREIGDRMEEGRALNTISKVNLWMGDHAAARQYGEQGLQLCSETGNRRDEAYALHQLGVACSYQHDYVTARAYFERALPIFRDVRDNFESRMLCFLGWLFGSLGDYTQAKAYCEQALDINSQDPEHWNGLGLVYHHLGENEAARDCFQRAVDLAQSRHNRHLQAWALTFLGHALTELDGLFEAADAYRQALDIRWEVGEAPPVPEPLAGLACVDLARGDHPQALIHVQEILAYLEAYPKLEGTIDPIRVYLTCYRVLRANADPRAAEVLEKGHYLLQEIASKIDDEALRRSYLENVPANRAIVAAWQESSQH